jgi:hypothetical protein
MIESGSIQLEYLGKEYKEMVSCMDWSSMMANWAEMDKDDDSGKSCAHSHQFYHAT